MNLWPRPPRARRRDDRPQADGAGSPLFIGDRYVGAVSKGDTLTGDMAHIVRKVPLYTADQIREAVERVRKEMAYPEPDGLSWAGNAALDALLHELGMEDR